MFRDERLKLLLPTLLSPERVILHSGILTDFHFYYLLLDTDNKPIKKELFQSGAWKRLTGRYNLLDASRLVDIATMQQSLYAGDILLPDLYSLFARGAARSKRDEAVWSIAERCLGQNPLLARNLVMYGFVQEIKKEKAQVAYHAALQSRDEALLRTLTKGPWRFACEGSDSPGSWNALFGSLKVALPSMSELMSEELYLAPEVPRLMTQRQRIAEEIVSYDFLADDAAEKTDLAALRQLISEAARNL